MTVQDGLVLDHLYMGIDADALEALASLFEGCPGAARSALKSGSDSWEGVYVRSRTGSYFEFLKQRRDGGLGIAISAYAAQYVDARKHVEEMPELPWQKGTRVWESGEPWFDYLSLGDYLDFETIRFNAWIMHYHPRHLPPIKRRAPGR